MVEVVSDQLPMDGKTETRAEQKCIYGLLEREFGSLRILRNAGYRCEMIPSARVTFCEYLNHHGALHQSIRLCLLVDSPSLPRSESYVYHSVLTDQQLVLLQEVTHSIHEPSHILVSQSQAKCNEAASRHVVPSLQQVKMQ